MDLDARMKIDHVIRVRADGSVQDVSHIHAPDVYVEVDAEGQISNEADVRMIEAVRHDGWELLTGWTGQYSYRGPIMHQSEYIGGRLAEHILETPGLYCATTMTMLGPEGSEDDGNLAEGWVLAFRDTVHYGLNSTACGELPESESDNEGNTEISKITCPDCYRIVNPPCGARIGGWVCVKTPEHDGPHETSRGSQWGQVIEFLFSDLDNKHRN